ncbi:hypothetical protein ACS0TY_035865 [Phlomoides rotata]
MASTTEQLLQVLYDTSDEVVGIATNDMGVAKNGSKKDNFQPGVELKGYHKANWS